MEKKIRRQLTLFVDKKDAKEIENIRLRFNPIQYHFIKSHVTLCRENEMEDIDAVLKNLQKLRHPKIALWLDPVTRFDNGKGVLIPAWSHDGQFYELRSKILEGLNVAESRPEPHITLMHPRNSTCTHEIFKTIQSIKFPAQLIFDKVSFIEQVEAGQWNTLKIFSLK